MQFKFFWNTFRCLRLCKIGFETSLNLKIYRNLDRNAKIQFSSSFCVVQLLFFLQYSTQPSSLIYIVWVYGEDYDIHLERF